MRKFNVEEVVKVTTYCDDELILEIASVEKIGKEYFYTCVPPNTPVYKYIENRLDEIRDETNK